MATKKKLPHELLPRGRPTIYNEELAKLICERVATHDIGLPRLCKKFDDMPDEDTIRKWLYRYPDFNGKYAQAKMKQANFLAEQCLEISDQNSDDYKENENGVESFNGEAVARARLRVDTRKWLASKLLPKQYGGDALLQQTREENDDLKEEVKRLREKLDEKNKRDY